MISFYLYEIRTAGFITHIDYYQLSKLIHMMILIKTDCPFNLTTKKIDIYPIFNPQNIYHLLVYLITLIKYLFKMLLFLSYTCKVN